MKVTLRQRKKGNKISLYLDHYQNGKRKLEYLKLYLIPEPITGRLSKIDKEKNSENLSLAESICHQRNLDYRSGKYSIEDVQKRKSSFLQFAEKVEIQRNTSKGNGGIWSSMIKLLKQYTPAETSFDEIDIDYVNGFKNYLESVSKKNGKKLSSGSKSAYYNRLKVILKEAVKYGMLQKNPAELTSGYKVEETQREFLTMEELQAASDTECEIPILKRAFLFSTLTGLRFSDVKLLKWSDVNHSTENGYYIRFRQKKTKGAETLFINEQALHFLGEKNNSEEPIFSDLNYSSWNNVKLQQWILKAGIHKTITFHCARHTHAVIQLNLGTDIFTLSKMLGHKEIRTTMLYANILNDKKKEAANRIKLKL